MWEIIKAPQISFSSTTTRSSLYETRSLRNKRAIAADPDLSLLGRFAASQQPAAAAGPRIPCQYPATILRELLYKWANLRRVVANAAPFLSLLHAADKHEEFVSCLGTAHAETALTGMECHHCGDMNLSSLCSSFLFREQPRPLRPPAFFLPGTCEEKAAGQRISAPGDELALRRLYLILSPQRAISRSLHPPGPASLCCCEQSGFIRWERWWRVGRQPVIGGFRCRGAVGLVQRPRPLAFCAAQRIQPRHGRRSFPRPV